jgi:hypothetical protein
MAYTTEPQTSVRVSYSPSFRGQRSAISDYDAPGLFCQWRTVQNHEQLLLIAKLSNLAATSDLVVIGANTRREVKRIQLGGGAAGILMEPGGSRDYVAVGWENGVTVIDLKTLEIGGHIDTGLGTRRGESHQAQREEKRHLHGEIRRLPQARDRGMKEKPGRYAIAVKVIDIFGNDTMTLVPLTAG